MELKAMHTMFKTFTYKVDLEFTTKISNRKHEHMVKSSDKVITRLITSSVTGTS